MIIVRLLSATAIIALVGCLEPTNTGSYAGGSYGATAAGLPPPPGRTDAERQARRDYYRGPRGHEF